MNRLREKTTATLLIAVLCLLSVLPSVMAADELTIYLDTKNAATAEWSDTQIHSGDYSAHLETTGTPGSGDEARIVIVMPEGFTLGDLETLSWWEFLVSGYPPHVDVYLELGVHDDSLNFEYAYNDVAQRYPGTGMPYGALTGAWYQTFGDDSEGPIQIDDDALAWPNSGPAGPPGSIELHSLADWKDGITYTTDYTRTIDADSIVTRLEIEVDNWVVQCDAYVDDLEINGGVYNLESNGVALTAVVRPPVISISVSPTNIDFGELIQGRNYIFADIIVTNTGETPVDLSASLIGDDGFYGESLKLDLFSVDSWSGFASYADYDDVGINLDVLRAAASGPHTATLVIWAEETPP